MSCGLRYIRSPTWGRSTCGIRNDEIWWSSTVYSQRQRTGGPAGIQLYSSCFLLKELLCTRRSALSLCGSLWIRQQSATCTAFVATVGVPVRGYTFCCWFQLTDVNFLPQLNWNTRLILIIQSWLLLLCQIPLHFPSPSWWRVLIHKKAQFQPRLYSLLRTWVLCTSCHFLPRSAIFFHILQLSSTFCHYLPLSATLCRFLPLSTTF